MSYQTSDLYLAAYLKTCGCQLVSTKAGQDKNRIEFAFNGFLDINGLVRDYFNGGQVNIQTFIQNLKSLRYICKTAIRI